MGLESVVEILKRCRNVDFDEEIIYDVAMLVEISEHAYRIVFRSGRIVDVMIHGDVCFVQGAE